MGIRFLCLIGCFSMIIRTPTVLSVLYACVFCLFVCFCICTCSAQLSMFHMERRSRNTLIIININIIISLTLGERITCLLVSCLTSQQHASVSQGTDLLGHLYMLPRSDRNCRDQTFYLTYSRCTDIGQTSPSAHSITPGAWQDRHWSSSF